MELPKCTVCMRVRLLQNIIHFREHNKLVMSEYCNEQVCKSGFSILGSRMCLVSVERTDREGAGSQAALEVSGITWAWIISIPSETHF